MIRFIERPPPVRTGVRTASDTPVIADGRVVQIPVDDVDGDEAARTFFGGQEPPNKQYPISEHVQKLLKSETASEPDLKDAIFTHLSQDHGIEFPKSCYQEETNSNHDKKYKESEVARLVRELDGVATDQKMERIEHGLLVATTSLPDLAPLFNTSEIRMGEMKNSKKYGQEEAQTQCLSYLLNLLYWLRAVKGRPVESVYGFFVCGCRCKYMHNRYAVGLLKLTAPKLFGDVVEAKRMVDNYRVQDMSGLCLLIQFLKEGKGWDKTPNVPDFSPAIPNLLVLPTQLWPDDNDNCKLVRHGTLSIVYHGKLAGIVEFVGNDSLFKSYLKVDQFLKMIPATLAEETNCYLKIRTMDSAGRMNPMDEMREAWPSLIKDEAHGFKDTYLFAPHVHKYFGMVLMKDKGKPLCEVSSFETSVLRQFSNIMSAAIFLCGVLPHGDVLPHNIVCDENNNLTLIDIDEGVVMKVAHGLPARENSKSVGDWYIALSYPNPLCTKAELYTKSQLLATGLYLFDRLQDNGKLTNKVLIETLMAKAKKIGNKIGKCNKEHRFFTKDEFPEVAGSVESAYELLEKIVDKWSSL